MEQELAQPSSRVGRTGTQHWPLYLLLTVGIVAILAGAAWLALQQRSAAGRAPAEGMLGLPAQLGGKTASQVEVGQTALQTIQSMHGKGFALTDGAVAHYGTATVWVAQTKDQAGASAMTDDMTAKIAGGRSPFSPTGTRQASRHTVYTLTGMGQAHFYWQTGNRVVWLAIDPGQADAGLQQLMAALK